MNVITNWTSQPAHQAPMVFDLDARSMKMYDGSNWAEIQEFNEPTMFTQEEYFKIKQMLDNYDKYERLIKEHYPEDYL